jgi:hypothetical protein
MIDIGMKWLILNENRHVLNDTTTLHIITSQKINRHALIDMELTTLEKLIIVKER